MGWVLGGLLGLVLLIAVSVGLFVQPFAPWWFGVGPSAPTTVARPSVPQQDVRTLDLGAPATPVPAITFANVGALIEAARSWLGVRYSWGGCSRQYGVDCSCFVQSAFAAIGVRLPRVTTDQIRVATPITAGQAAAGDLVFFDNTCTGCGANPTHVGLVLDHGGGMMIDAGDPVRVEPIYGGHNARYGRVLP